MGKEPLSCLIWRGALEAAGPPLGDPAPLDEEPHGGAPAGKARVHLPLYASRLVFGACDEKLGLRSGTCFLAVMIGNERRVITGPVLVYLRQ